jgi:hypothetical protein
MPSLAAAQLESHDERTRLRAEAELDAVVENISRLENPGRLNYRANFRG